MVHFVTLWYTYFIMNERIGIHYEKENYVAFFIMRL